MPAADRPVEPHAAVPTDGRRRPPTWVLGGMAALAVIGAVVTALSLSDGSEAQPVGLRTPGSTTVAPPPTTTTAPPTTTAPTTTTTLAPNPGRVGYFLPAPGGTGIVGSGGLITYSVEVEEAVRADPASTATIIDAALGDPRGWTAGGNASFQRVETGGQVKIVLATPPTVDQMCLPLNTAGIYSCREGNQLNINSDRWAHGTDDWPLGIDDYRAHVINHEMGHALGHDHVFCPGPGAVAPVMMQQTKGLGECVANPWPWPGGS